MLKHTSWPPLSLLYAPTAQHLSHPEDISMIWQDSFCLAPLHEWSEEDKASWQIKQASYTAFTTNYSKQGCNQGDGAAGLQPPPPPPPQIEI
jgi:hypothetical protein